jgi:hypothetical protein
MELPIRNINDLRDEIVRLKQVEQEQSHALGHRFKSPSALFSSIYSLFSSTNSETGEKTKGFFDQDLVGLISRIVLPFTLNKTVFKNSGFLIKTLVGLVSQKASHFITEDSVTSVWDKIKSFFPSKTKHETPEHKGVPAFSESY